MSLDYLLINSLLLVIETIKSITTYKRVKRLFVIVRLWVNRFIIRLQRQQLFNQPFHYYTIYIRYTIYDNMKIDKYGEYYLYDYYISNRLFIRIILFQSYIIILLLVIIKEYFDYFSYTIIKLFSYFSYLRLLQLYRYFSSILILLQLYDYKTIQLFLIIQNYLIYQLFKTIIII